jgi:ubiquinol-cytochrome c reductase cytochrome b subunit
MAVTSVILVLLTVKTHGAELYAPAQPASNFVARPEWYFLFLFQLLKYFEGPLQIVATVIIPGAVTTFLVALPWLDKAASRRPAERVPLLAGVATIMAGVATLTTLAIAEDAKNQKYQKGVAAAHVEADRARELAKAGVLPPGGDAVFLNDPQVATRALFKEHCETCHTLDGVGGEEAPNLTHFKSREWLSAVIRNPRDKRFFGGTKTHKEMEPYPASSLPDDKLAAVVEYLTSLMGDEAGHVDAALAERGKKLFEDDLDCNSCHEVKPGESGSGPNLFGGGTRAWIQRVVKEAAAEDLYGKSSGMPKFGKKLTDEEIRQLSDLIAAGRNAKNSG